MTTQHKVTVPDLGEFSDVEVIDVLAQSGDQLEAEAPLLTIETDKASMDIPTVVAGRLVEMLVGVGDRVSSGSEIAVLEIAEDDTDRTESLKVSEPSSDETVQTRVVAAPPPVRATPGSLPAINEVGFATAHAGPSVRKLARELGVDLGRVRGSGIKSRITSADVKSFVKAILSGGAAVDAAPLLPATPIVDFAKFGEIEEKPLSRIQKISGPRVQASWINLPHVTQHDEADFTETESRRQKDKAAASEKGIKLTPLAFIMRACVLALKEFPKFNTSLNQAGDALVYKKYVNMGFAADTPGGLVVPVVHGAHKMDLMDLARSLAELASAAREGKIKVQDLQGGTFTISSLGGIGGTAFTPIINAPEVAILGVSKSQTRPVWNGTEFVPRLMLPLALSYDHRVIDGAAAARFTTRLGELLSDPAGLLATPE